MQLKKWTTFSFGTLAALALLGGNARAQEAQSTSLDVAIQNALNETSHLFIRQVGTPFEGVERAWQAANRDRDLRTYLLSDGVRVLPRSDEHGGWRWGLALERFGRTGLLRDAGEAELRVDGQRAEYVRQQIVEWYVNDQRGLEQGFDIAERPAGEGELELGFDLEGEFETRIAAGGRDVVFADAEGEDAVSYANLTAFDAAGRKLPARFEERPGGLAIVVDDTDASYPVTIDPLINNLQAILTPTGTPGGNRLGTSVSIDGNRAVVGASSNEQAGLAYTLEKVGSFWQIDTKLTLGASAEVGDAFGQSVSILGKHVAIGSPQRDFTGINSGAVYYYILGVNDEWVLVQALTSATTAAGDQFGFDVDQGIDSTGSNQFLIVGAPSRVVGGNNLQGAAYTFFLTGQWTPTGFLTDPNGSFADRYGFSVGIDGDTAVVGVLSEDGAEINMGAAHVWKRSGLTFVADEFLSSPTPQAGGSFGRSVDISGDRIIIGATGERKAHVFTDNGINWVHEEQLVGDGGGLSTFGVAVALDQVGNSHAAIVGALGNEAAYIYEGTFGNWSQTAKLQLQDLDGLDDFGSSVALQGSLALVGAPGRDIGDDETGGVFSYERVGSTWIPVQAIIGTNWDADENLGFSTAVDGDTAIVGATGDSDAAFRNGAAYVFTRNGSSWSMQAKLTAGDDVQKSSQFGQSVDVDGDAAVVGAAREDLSAFDEGAAYVYERNGETWSRTERLLASDAGQEDLYGTAVSIQGDHLVIGAPGDDDRANDAGAAYVYERQGGDWNFVQKLEGFDGVAKADFGTSADIDGSFMIVGSPDQVTNNVKSGSAYIFERTASNWTARFRITPSGGNDDDEFGTSVSLSGERAVIGAPFDDTASVNSGAVYVFEKAGILWLAKAKITASDAAPSDHFGTGVALENALIAVGAKDDSNVVLVGGAVYVYHETPEGWVELGKLEDPTLGIGSDLGRSVALSHTTLVTGAPAADEIGTNSGKAYVVLVPGLEPEVYCTAKANSCGNLPAISSEGTPSATDGSGFVVRLSRAKAGKFGVLLYSASGRAAVPFQGGLLCVEPAGLSRTISVQDVDGSPGACNGMLELDMNAFATGSLGGNPSAVLAKPGVRINCQFWARDIPGRSLLSNALEYVIGN